MAGRDILREQAEEALTGISKIPIGRRNGLPNIWEHSFDKHAPVKYDYHTAQTLLEFTYVVSFHNTAADRGYPNLIPLTPRNFPVKYALNTVVLDKPVNVGYMFHSPTLNMIVIAMSATYNSTTLDLDFDYQQVPPYNLGGYEPGTLVHRGFYVLYSKIQDQLFAKLNKWCNRDTQILITGISLGGATSTLCKQDVGMRYPNQVIHYSFASPRIFNIPGQEVYNRCVYHTYRVCNGSDIVPCLPLPIMPSTNFSPDYFIHVKGLQFFDTNLKTYYHNHVDAYLQKFDVNSF